MKNHSESSGHWSMSSIVLLLKGVKEHGRQWSRIHAMFEKNNEVATYDRIKRKAYYLLGERRSKVQAESGLPEDWNENNKKTILRLHEKHGERWGKIFIELKSNHSVAEIEMFILRNCECESCRAWDLPVRCESSIFRGLWAKRKASKLLDLFQHHLKEADLMKGLETIRIAMGWRDDWEEEEILQSILKVCGVCQSCIKVKRMLTVSKHVKVNPKDDTQDNITKSDDIKKKSKSTDSGAATTRGPMFYREVLAADPNTSMHMLPRGPSMTHSAVGYISNTKKQEDSTGFQESPEENPTGDKHELIRGSIHHHGPVNIPPHFGAYYMYPPDVTAYPPNQPEIMSNMPRPWSQEPIRGQMPGYLRHSHHPAEASLNENFRSPPEYYPPAQIHNYYMRPSLHPPNQYLDSRRGYPMEQIPAHISNTRAENRTNYESSSFRQYPYSSIQHSAPYWQHPQPHAGHHTYSAYDHMPFPSTMMLPDSRQVISEQRVPVYSSEDYAPSDSLRSRRRIQNHDSNPAPQKKRKSNKHDE